MASIRICFNAYAAASAAALWLLLLHTWIRCDEFYAAVASLTTSKIALAIEYNFFFMCFVGTSKMLLRALVGRLRDLEIEQIVDNGRVFLFDTVMFLVLSSPTLDGSELSPLPLAKFLLLLVTLKTMHLVLQFKGSSIFELGIPRFSQVARLFILLMLLLMVDMGFVLFFYRNASRESTFYLWLLFELLGMLSCSVVALFKFMANLVDARTENGWTSKPAFMFYLDMLHDVLSLTNFLVFMLVYFVTQPSRLPAYMISDIVHVSKTLYRRILSFQKYRALSRNLETRFPDATPEELEAADTCIICRDLLSFDSKKLPCSHIFHIDCLRAWLVQQQSCPTCRADIPVESERTGPTPPPTGAYRQQPNADVVEDGGSANRVVGRQENSTRSPQLSSTGMPASSTPYGAARRADTTQRDDELRQTTRRMTHPRVVELSAALNQAIQECNDYRMDATVWAAEAQILQLQNAYLALKNIASLFPPEKKEGQGQELNQPVTELSDPDLLQQNKKPSETHRMFDSLHIPQPLLSASPAPSTALDSTAPPFSIQKQLLETQSLQQQLYQRQLMQQQQLLQQQQLMQQQLMQQQNLIQQLLAQQSASHSGAPRDESGQHPYMTLAAHQIPTFAGSVANRLVSAHVPSSAFATYHVPMPTFEPPSNGRDSVDQGNDLNESAPDSAAKSPFTEAKTSTTEVSQQQGVTNENPEATIRLRRQADEDELQRLRLEHQLRWLSSRNSG